ncbi:ABC transporter ATP-binding protein [Campylobacter fetus]|uniref:ABC transporter permease n=1 Tax=Campylobacter fetus subsp. testudinum TaxID=1507806 RepID=A0AAX0HC90_CAMFE|nr:ABC transporter ATP-binding protein [Campylobacter fetus]AVK82028.1 ABC transporter ATP-binding protein [Campylobacter fetus subsp. testudinum]EAK0826152.1 ABC transporter ATP-binding protein [Campylobacter fetus]EAK0830256.1 ABC transporter ATP-binding protein [Campylobacter fetus]MPB71952.1 ABC transporter ATP-binding protein [Campylobacter fetus]MPB77538.1 ABC transporter ATP-binding protein [Campylobacter fetus]
MNGVKDVFKRFIPYFKDYIPQFVLAIVGMIMASVGTAVSAYLVKPVLDKIFVEKNESLLYLLPYAIIAIYFLKSLGTYLQAYFTAYIGQDMVKRFRQKLLDNLLILDMSFFNKFRTGELISRNTSDIERIRSIVSSMIPELIRELITIIGLLGVVIYQSPTLAVFALVIFPIAIYPLSRLAKKMKKISRKSQEKTSDISSVLSEIFSNIEIVKANNAENKELKRFDEHNEKFFRLNLKSVKINELVSPMMETLGSIGVAVVIIIGGKQVIDGTITVGSFFSFLTALFMLYTPIKRISSLYNKMQDAVAASERTFELLDKSANIIGGNLEFPKTVNSITLQDIHFSYDDKKVLKGISLKANKGQMIAIVGGSGGGKTSLINLLMRFYDANSGSILINENDICEFSLKSLRQNIGLVTQRVYIFNDSVAANVAYSGEIDEKKVVCALKMANAYNFVDKLDNGIYTILDEFGANLSGGQRQRIAIARALYKNPQILIFDEATSALDNESEKEITNAIEALSKDKIIFVIAHRLSTVKNADKIAVLDSGKIVGFGEDKTLENECEVYKKLKLGSLS